MKRITVIVPTWNGCSTIVGCIKSLSNQTYKPFEIIVVDNASTDDTADEVDRLVKKYKTIRLVKNEKNLGVTGGRNKGIEASGKESDYLLFFDHDMIADKKMLENLVKVADNKIGIVTPKIYYKSERKRIWSAGTDINLWTGQVMFRNGMDVGQYNKTVEVGVSPAAILVKRELVEKIGGFDNIFESSWEDADFCYRAKRAGFKTFYTPDAIAYHDIEYNTQKDAERLLVRYAKNLGKNRIIFMKRFGKNFFIFSLFLPLYLIYYLYLALKYKHLSGYLKFLKGTLDGFILVNTKERRRVRMDTIRVT